jgi:hypothetical protein
MPREYPQYGSSSNSPRECFVEVKESVAEENLKISLTVGSPEHYTKGSIEAIDYIKASMTKEQYEGFLLGNVKKYTHRYKYKGEPVKDLMKAAWYLDRLIKEVKDAT